MLSAIGARLLLDPFQLPYYLCPFITVFAVWLWTSPRSGRMRWSIAACVGLAVLVVFGFLAEHAALWAVIDGLVLAVIAWVVMAERPAPTIAD